MDLGKEGAARQEVVVGKACHGPVKKKGVVILYEQGLVRLELHDMRGHGFFFFYGDIRGIADDYRDGGQAMPLVFVQEVEEVEVDGGMVGIGIAPCNGQGAGAVITGMDG